MFDRSALRPRARTVLWAGATCAAAVALSIGGVLAYWFLRPNRAFVDPALAVETWAAVADGVHNSNTDLIWWAGHFFLVHAASPYHMGSESCRLIVRRSADGRRWERMADLGIPGEDIRDPKFAVIGRQLLLYALPNRGFKATPYGTVYARSDDGLHWSSFTPVAHPGWLFWRPKSRDGEHWFVPAYWHQHGRSILLTSADGVRWDVVSEIWSGDGNDETDVEFLPDGRIIATARLEVTADNLLGNRAAATLIATASPPYRRWTHHKSRVTRLDGPALFSHDGRVFAVARYQPGRRGVFTRLGSVFSRKRTSLFLVEPEGLVYLSDLPSAGDTSYAGVVVRDRYLYASYYTSDISRDYPWALGMVLPSDIQIAKIDLASLSATAAARTGAVAGD